MARIAVLTDRSPNDFDWKGAFIWKLILSLSESQHQVLVLTPQEIENLSITHSRLTIARPAIHWRADKLPQYAQALLQFRPDIIHTFALKPERSWSQLTLWPYLNAAMTAFPHIRRYSTLFDSEDIDAKYSNWIWHQGSHALTVFTPTFQAQARQIYQGQIEISPLEFEVPDEVHTTVEEDVWLIPAPVSEWNMPQTDLQILTQALELEPERRVKIIGGWGDSLASEKRQGWKTLVTVAGQVSMGDPLNLSDFVHAASGVRAFWMNSLPINSWRSLLAQEVAKRLDKELIGVAPVGLPGSTSNFISRLYSQRA